MPRAARRLQRVQSQFDIPGLHLVLHRRATGPAFWEAEIVLPGDSVRIYRSTGTTNLASAHPKALALYMEAKASKEVHGRATGPRFARLHGPYREFLDRKVADVRKRLMDQPDVVARKVRSIEKNWTLFVKHIMPFFKDLPIAGISEQRLKTYAQSLKGRGGTTAARSTVKSHEWVLREAMRTGIDHGWINSGEIPKLPTVGNASGPPRPTFRTPDWNTAFAGLTDRWVKTGLTDEDDRRNRLLPLGDRTIPNMKRIVIEGRRILRAQMVIGGTTALRPGELDALRLRDLVLADPDGEAGTPAVLITIRHGTGKKRPGRQVRVRGADADAVRAAVADLRKANPALTANMPLFARSFDGRIPDTLAVLQHYLHSMGLLRAGEESGRITRYAWRHYAITRKVSRGIPLGEIAADAGTSLLMMQEFYFQRDKVVGGEEADVLTPPRLRPLIVNPYAASSGTTLVAAPDGRIIRADKSEVAAQGEQGTSHTGERSVVIPTAEDKEEHVLLQRPYQGADHLRHPQRSGAEPPHHARMERGDGWPKARIAPA
jgi:hypothetical protein